MNERVRTSIKIMKNVPYKHYFLPSFANGIKNDKTMLA